MNKGRVRVYALAAVAMFSLPLAQAQDSDLRCATQKLLGYLHSCPLVVSKATADQICLLGKVRDTMTRLGNTIDTEQLQGRLSLRQASDLRTELDIISDNLDDAVSDGTLTYEEAHFVVKRAAALDNRTDMLVASHPETRVAFDTDIDIRLRDLSGRLAADTQAGLLTREESDEISRSVAIVAGENAAIKSDRVITASELRRMKASIDAVGARMDQLSTNQWVSVRTLFTWSDFEPRQQELANRIGTALDQGRISADRANFLRSELRKVGQMAETINAHKSGGIVATPLLITLRQKQNLVDRQITQEIRLAAGHRPWY